MRASGLVWSWKWIGLAVRANRIYCKGLDEHPKFFSRTLDIRIWITQRLVCYGRQSLKKGVSALRGSFDLENELYLTRGKTVCISKILTDVHKKFSFFDFCMRASKKMVCYSPRKSSKMVGMRALELVWPWKWVELDVRSIVINRQDHHGNP